MTNYLDMVKELEKCGYKVHEDYDNKFYWSTYSTYNDGFETEEAAWLDAWIDCNERGYND